MNERQQRRYNADWKGMKITRTYVDVDGNPFDGGIGKYAAYYADKFLGYGSTNIEAEEVYLDYICGRGR